ncbi:DNA-directed RNA polymerases I, II, and III subunit RPABC4-like isoform X1 [Megachile rotundata]|uniref:DNA-directed RNA polymerases I, II, and III subunit RPABC4-like isoform X1 n=1 Tax=Megachile rotundata TaxID=143995 RepID=UPI003FCF1744
MESSRSSLTPKLSTIYICAECYHNNEICPKEPIRCKECGYRVMFKKRIRKLIVLDAR